MTKAEIMNCAAALAAGMIASEKREPCVEAEEAVALMYQIAEVITAQEKDEKSKASDKWFK